MDDESLISVLSSKLAPELCAVLTCVSENVKKGGFECAISYLETKLRELNGGAAGAVSNLSACAVKKGEDYNTALVRLESLVKKPYGSLTVAQKESVMREHLLSWIRKQMPPVVAIEAGKILRCQELKSFIVEYYLLEKGLRKSRNFWRAQSLKRDIREGRPRNSLPLQKRA